MIQTSSKGYMAPWSARRETVGLLGTFLVFLMGFPGHSETMMDSAKQMASQLIRLILVFLGLSAPVAQTPKVTVIPAPKAAMVKVTSPRKSIHPVVPNLNSMHLRTDPVYYHFTYHFEGKATWHGDPSPQASVLVRLRSENSSVAKGTVTSADGSYSLDVAIDAADKSPVDWVVEAYTPDFKPVELTGRQIVQREGDTVVQKEPIIVTTPVEFFVSLSK